METLYATGLMKPHNDRLNLFFENQGKMGYASGFDCVLTEEHTNLIERFDFHVELFHWEMTGGIDSEREALYRWAYWRMRHPNTDISLGCADQRIAPKPSIPVVGDQWGSHSYSHMRMLHRLPPNELWAVQMLCSTVTLTEPVRVRFSMIGTRVE